MRISPADEPRDTLRERLLDRFKDVARPHIALEPTATDDAAIPVGDTRIGGRPDVPAFFAWPKDDQGRSLAFLAQLNLRDLSTFDASGELPPSGHLLFFYDARQESWGFDPKDKDKFEVVFMEGSDADLRRAALPEDVPEEAHYKACAVKALSGRSLPGWEHDLVGRRLSDQESEVYSDLAEEMAAATQVLGHSSNIQNPMELECELVTNGLYCGDTTGYNDPLRKQLEPNAGQWRLLFQLDSVDDAGMMWGDSGKIYFWIKNDDLRARRFDKAWCILQCY